MRPRAPPSPATQLPNPPSARSPSAPCGQRTEAERATCNQLPSAHAPAGTVQTSSVVHCCSCRTAESFSAISAVESAEVPPGRVPPTRGRAGARACRPGALGRRPRAGNLPRAARAAVHRRSCCHIIHPLARRYYSSTKLESKNASTQGRCSPGAASLPCFQAVPAHVPAQRVASCRCSVCPPPLRRRAPSARPRQTLSSVRSPRSS